MINWRDTFGASDYAEPDPYVRLVIALAHGFAGAGHLVFWLWLIGDLVWAGTIHYSVYVVKECVLDLRHIIGRSRTKWGNADLLTILDSAIDLMFWFAGGFFSMYLLVYLLSHAVAVWFGTIVASFTYYTVRRKR